MDITSEKRAQVLIQALPYIQKFAGQTIVVKYGGNAMISPQLKSAVMSDIVLMQLVGINVVLVHGGGPEISEMLKKVGKESKFVNGMRVTDEETVEIVQMVLAGKVNKGLVQQLEEHGGKALGLCGLDSRMIMAEKLIAADDLGFVGEITEVNSGVIEDAIEKGYVPIISTIAGGYHGELYNINADIGGLLRDKEDESTLIPVVNVSDVPSLKRERIISGGMIPKIDCCVEAVRQGVKRAHIIDGRIEHSILIEMFSDEGIGTMFY